MDVSGVCAGSVGFGHRGAGRRPGGSRLPLS